MPQVSSQVTLKRIQREIADIKKEDLGPITLLPISDNLFQWKGEIPGPAGSVYEGGIFGVDVVLANDYPFSAPKVTFSTRIYHMNISERGNVCIDILKNSWSPALSLFKVMLSLSSLLTDPNPQDPLVPQIATEFIQNRVQHDETARRWTQLYAQPKLQSTSLPATSSPPAETNESARANRKEKARAVSSTASSLTASSSRTRSASETVTINDSDSESNPLIPVTAKKRKRNGAGAVLGSGEVVDLTDGDVEERGGSTKRRRKKHRHGTGGASNGEVIIIDD